MLAPQLPILCRTTWTLMCYFSPHFLVHFVFACWKNRAVSGRQLEPCSTQRFSCTTRLHRGDSPFPSDHSSWFQLILQPNSSELTPSPHLAPCWSMLLSSSGALCFGGGRSSRRPAAAEEAKGKKQKQLPDELCPCPRTWQRRKQVLT